MKRNNAFTLIELLIASSIFVVIIVTVYSAFHSGIFGYRNIEETIDTYQAARSILERINLDLRNAFSYSDVDSKFTGAQDKVSFLTSVDTFREDNIAQEIALVSYELGNDGRLMRLCRRNQEALKDDSIIEPEEMADNIGIIFTYFYIDPVAVDKSLQKKDVWDDKVKLPAAVKISLTIKGKRESNFEHTVYLALAE